MLEALRRQFLAIQDSFSPFLHALYKKNTETFRFFSEEHIQKFACVRATAATPTPDPAPGSPIPPSPSLSPSAGAASLS